MSLTQVSKLHNALREFSVQVRQRGTEEFRARSEGVWRRPGVAGLDMGGTQYEERHCWQAIRHQRRPPDEPDVPGRNA
jgi:hypothetical protein